MLTTDVLSQSRVCLIQLALKECDLWQSTEELISEAFFIYEMCKKYVDVIEKHFNRKLKFAKKISSLIPRREIIESRFAEKKSKVIE